MEDNNYTIAELLKQLAEDPSWEEDEALRAEAANLLKAGLIRM